MKSGSTMPSSPVSPNSRVSSSPKMSIFAMPSSPETSFSRIPSSPGTPGSTVPSSPGTPGSKMPSSPGPPGSAVSSSPVPPSSAVPSSPGTPSSAAPSSPARPFSAESRSPGPFGSTMPRSSGLCGSTMPSSSRTWICRPLRGRTLSQQFSVYGLMDGSRLTIPSRRTGVQAHGSRSPVRQTQPHRRMQHSKVSGDYPRRQPAPCHPQGRLHRLHAWSEGAHVGYRLGYIGYASRADVSRGLPRGYVGYLRGREPTRPRPAHLL